MRPSVSYSGTVYFTLSLLFSSLFLFFSAFRAAPLHFLGNLPFLSSFLPFFLCFLSFFPSLPFGICSPFLFPLFSPFPFVLVSFVCNIYYGVSFQFPPFFFYFSLFFEKKSFFFLLLLKKLLSLHPLSSCSGR